MRLLLDTHALLWGLLDHPRLSTNARAAMAEPGNVIIVSAVSILEITLKHRLGKLDEAEPFIRNYPKVLVDLDWEPLPMKNEHAALAGGLDIPHKDPFDRLLIAQSLVERMPLVSTEVIFDSCGVERIW